MSETRAINEFIDYIYQLNDFPLEKSIRSRFIHDFILAIIDNNDFTIKLEDIAIWLQTREKALKQTLTQSYIEGEDYIVNKSQHKTGGRPKDDVFLTTDCFKRLCMRSRTASGEEIRSYFILVEEMYREYIINKIYKRQQLEGGETKYFDDDVSFPIGPCVYVIKISQPKKKPMYKIGRTKNLNRRFKELSREIYGKLEVVIQEVFEHVFLEVCAQSFLKDFKNDELSEVYQTDLETIQKWLSDCKRFRMSEGDL